MKKGFVLMFIAMVLLASCSNKNSGYGYDDYAATESSDAFYTEEEVYDEWDGGEYEKGEYYDLDITQNTPASVMLTGESGSDRIETTATNKGKKIIKTASLSMEVDDYRESRDDLSKVVNGYDAYVSSESEYSYSTSITNNIEIRVISEDFDALLEKIEDLGVGIDNKSVSANDVTEEYVDIQARLKTKKEVEQRYIELLRQANSIPDILDVESELRIIREEIESAEGRLKYLKDQVGYSTISLYMYEETGSVVKYNFFHKIKKGFLNGWDGLLQIIIGLVTIWPVWLVLILFILFIRYIIKRLMRKGTK